MRDYQRGPANMRARSSCARRTAVRSTYGVSTRLRSDFFSFPFPFCVKKSLFAQVVMSPNWLCTCMCVCMCVCVRVCVCVSVCLYVRPLFASRVCLVDYYVNLISQQSEASLALSPFFPPSLSLSPPLFFFPPFFLFLAGSRPWGVGVGQSRFGSALEYKEDHATRTQNTP